MLGDQVKRFESGSRGVLTISSGKGDPGGKSYGTYQLASKTGTLQTFIKTTAVRPHLEGIPIASPKFDAAWKYLATTRSDLVKQAEFDFIKRTHYDPARKFADSLKIGNTDAINEAIWSMSIQHGKVNQILRNAVAMQRKNPTKYPSTEEGTIHALYDARRDYINGLNLSASLKASLIKNRCVEERKEVLKLLAN